MPLIQTRVLGKYLMNGQTNIADRYFDRTCTVRLVFEARGMYYFCRYIYRKQMNLHCIHNVWAKIHKYPH